MKIELVASARKIAREGSLAIFALVAFLGGSMAQASPLGGAPAYPGIPGVHDGSPVTGGDLGAGVVGIVGGGILIGSGIAVLGGAAVGAGLAVVLGPALIVGGVAALGFGGYKLFQHFFGSHAPADATGTGATRPSSPTPGSNGNGTNVGRPANTSPGRVIGLPGGAPPISPLHHNAGVGVPH